MSTRSELKENLLASKVEASLTWILEHRGPLLAGAGLVLVTILIGSVFVIRRNEMRDTALTQLSMAEALIGAQQYDRANQILKDMKATISDTALQSQIAYYEGIGQLSVKNFDQAVASFSEAADKGGSLAITPLALSNLGFAFEQKKDYSTAAQTYEKFMLSYSEHFLAPRVQLALGRSYAMAGKMDESKKALTQLIDLYPTSHWAENARSIMDKNRSR